MNCQQRRACTRQRSAEIEAFTSDKRSSETGRKKKKTQTFVWSTQLIVNGRLTGVASAFLRGRGRKGPN